MTASEIVNRIGSWFRRPRTNGDSVPDEPLNDMAEGQAGADLQTSVVTESGDIYESVAAADAVQEAPPQVSPPSSESPMPVNRDAAAESMMRLGEMLEQMAGRNEELAGTLREIAAESQRHGVAFDKAQTSLDAIGASLATIGENNRQLATASQALNDAITTMTRDNAANTQVVEQVRDQVAQAHESLSNTICRHAKRFTQMVIVAIAVLAALTVLMVVRTVLGK